MINIRPNPSYIYGKYNSIGRVSDCGSESFWFESRYLPINLSIIKRESWFLNSKKAFATIKVSMFSLWCLIRNYKFLLKLSPCLSSSEFIISLLFKNFLKDNLSYTPVACLWKLKLTKSKPTNSFKLYRHLDKLVSSSGIVFSKKLSVHSSFNLYYYNTSNNINLTNLSKFLVLWRNILIFLTNIFYFEVNYTIFTNPYFRYEALALNFKKTAFIVSIWRLTSTFIFFIKNRATLEIESFFLNLIRNSFILSFVIDIYYHKTTLYFLKKFNFVTVGPVPVSSNLYILSVALPVNSNSIFSNLIFFRLLLKIRRLTLPFYPINFF